MNILCFTKQPWGVFLILSLFPYLLQAQSKEKSPLALNAVYLELGGNGGFYSLNYEKTFYQKGNFASAARVGFSIFPVKFESGTFLAPLIPVEIIGLLGMSQHKLEFGMGITPYVFPISTNYYQEFSNYQYGNDILFRLGYRYQKPEGGFFFRAGYTPILGFVEKRYQDIMNKKIYFTPFFGGISMGKSF